MAVKIGGKVLGAKPEPAKDAPKDLQKDGRRRNPTKRGYPARVFERLFEFIAAGEDLTTACKRQGMPSPHTVRRRMLVDEKLAEQFKQVYRIHVQGAVDSLLRLPKEALEGQAKVTTADRLAAAKLQSDNIKWAAQKLLAEYQGLEDGGVQQITVNILNSPDAPAGNQYVPAGQPVLKIVGGAAAQPAEGGGDE